LVQVFINFIISSGSGQALVTMPIMAPLADMLGITRQTAVLAFQLGDGFTHVLYPTSGYFMAALAIGGVSYTKWIKFFFPLFIMLCYFNYFISYCTINWLVINKHWQTEKSSVFYKALIIYKRRPFLLDRYRKGRLHCFYKKL